MENELQSKKEQTLITTDFSKFETYLSELNLPTDNIIASPEERFRIMNAMPEFITSLPPEVTKDARYLSKFIAGAAVGLFDASLNFVWNEVVINIRKKVVLYGLDLFFDEAVGIDTRSEYKTEDDLSGIKDRTLLDTCLKLELISDIVHNKLVHILDMRNNIGASHPTQYSINSYELLGWLQTCINEVLNQNASDSAITVKKIITNIKKSSTLLSTDMITQFSDSLTNVSKVLIGNLLGSLFGIYCSAQTDLIVKENTIAIVPYVWKQALDSKKYDLGIQTDKYRKSLDTEKVKNAESFFEICDGNRYLSLDERIIRLDTLCTKLYNTHYEWNNFYNEVPVIRQIMTYIKKSEDVPAEIGEKLIETILLCRIGREVSWNDGISPGGLQYYNRFFSLLNKEQIITLLKIINKPVIRSNFYGKIVTKNMKSILTLVQNNTLGDRVNDVINYILAQSDICNLINTKHYQEIANGVII